MHRWLAWRPWQSVWGMFAAESYASRHHITIVAMVCLCVLLGGPSYAAGAKILLGAALLLAATRRC